MFERVFAAVSMRMRMLLIMTGAQLCAAVVQQGFGSLGPFVVSFFHINKAQLGLSYTALMGGSALLAFAAGICVDRFGERAVTVFAGVTIFASLLIGAAVPSYIWLVGSLFLLGLAYASCLPAGGRAILAWFDKDRAMAMGLRQTGVPMGAVVGGLILPPIALHSDYRVAMVVGAFIALFGTAGLALFYRDPPGGRGHRVHEDLLTGVRVFLRDPRSWLCSMAAVGLNSAQTVSAGFIALSAVVLGHYTVPVAALVFSTSMAAAICGRIFWGWLSDNLFRGNRTIPLGMNCLLSGTAALGIAFTAPDRHALLFASAFLMGFAGAGWNGLFATVCAEIAGVRYAGSALGVGSSVNFIAGAVGPVLFGMFADAHGLPEAWRIFAMFVALTSIPAFLATRRYRPPVADTLEPQTLVAR